MVTKAPGLLRRKKGRGVVPDHPQVVGNVSILLNATGLRKLPRIGYTRAGQVVFPGWTPGRLARLKGSRPAVMFEHFIGSGVPAFQIFRVLARIWQAFHDAKRISRANDVAFAVRARRRRAEPGCSKPRALRTVQERRGPRRSSQAARAIDDRG
ncbi:hypothetical protein [Paraburkholderia terricola]|uniref:hypothetical protein n=1 Tax=Paraburkholderia terricola TaxID=169427 RepID=UPI001FD0C148|nr:hypothetical protein [Paraburkholderia terricola]